MMHEPAVRPGELANSGKLGVVDSDLLRTRGEIVRLRGVQEDKPEIAQVDRVGLRVLLAAVLG